MAFTAIVQSITFQNDIYSVAVIFNDSVTGWISNKIYTLPIGTTQAQVVTQITADGTTYKSGLAVENALQSKVGFVITI